MSRANYRRQSADHCVSDLIEPTPASKASTPSEAEDPSEMPIRFGICVLAVGLLVTGSCFAYATPTDPPKPNALPAAHDASSRYPQIGSFAKRLPSAEETAAVRADLGRIFGREWIDFERMEGRRIGFSVSHADLNA
jgi:hypothetical protein